MKKLILIFLISTNCLAGNKWECIERALGFCHTWRMIVPSGWVISSDNSSKYSVCYAMTFVPDANHEWKV